MGLLRFLKHSFEILKNPLPFHRNNFEKLGDSFRLQIGARRSVVFSRDPILLEYALQKKWKRFTKTSIQTKDVARYLGKGLLTSEGELWRRQRKLIQPGFHKKQIDTLYKTVGTTITKQLTQLPEEGMVDLYPVFGRLAFRVVVESLFSGAVSDKEIEALRESTESNQHMLVRQLRQPYLKWYFENFGVIKRQLEKRERSREVLRGIIRARQVEDAPRGDLLDMLLAARYEDGGAIEEEQLIDEILVLFVAGHETTANALSFTAQLLAKHPKWQEAIRAEAGRGPMPGSVTEQVLLESMRLFPPAYFIDRQNQADETVQGIDIPARTDLLFSVYEIHRHPDYWEDPEAFHPERFAPEAGKPPPYFYPFGAGPRKCIGAYFAMMEMTLVVQQLLERFQLQPAGPEIRIKPLITLKPANARVKLENRGNRSGNPTNTSGNTPESPANSSSGSGIKNSFRALIFWLFCFVQAFGQQPDYYEIDTRFPVHDLDPVLEIFADTSDAFTPTELLGRTETADFIGDNLPRYLQVGTLYWGRVRIKATDSLKGWILQFEDKMLGPPAWTKSNGRVDVFGYVGNKEIFHKRTGVQYPATERDTDLHWTLNSIDLSEVPPDTLVTLILRVEGNDLGYPSYFYLSARAPDQLFYHEPYSFHRSFNIFMFGVTLIFFLYHLLQFLYLRERVIFWFALWLFCCCFTQAMTAGLIIGDITRYRLLLHLLVANGIFYVFWFFGRAFTDSRRKFPKIDRLLLVLTGIIMVEILVVIGLLTFTDIQPIMTGVGYHYVFLFIYAILGVFLSLAFLWQKDSFARYFGVGSLIANIALIIGTLWSLSIMRPPFGADPYAFGILSQLFIYSFGIVYRRRKLALQAQNEKLEATRVQAEVDRIRDLDRLKTRFFTNISHEFRTPLTLIRAPLQEAMKASEAGSDSTIPVRRETFAMVNRNTARLQQLVDELLELSRLESGKVTINLRSDGILDYLKAFVHSFESLAESKKIALTAEFPEDTSGVHYDVEKLQRIISNLLSNAIKYTPAGGTVAFRSRLENHTLKFSIVDSGKGIAASEIDHIFERFYRVEGSEEKGSGIGLALCKELVDLMGGSISVKSEPGSGTTFSVDLPTRAEDFPYVSSLATEAATRDKIPVAGSQNTVENVASDTGSDSEKQALILVVEDNPDLRQFISEALRSGYRVEVAPDGAAGEKRALDRIPDLIVSDVMMPIQDGFQMCRKLKAHPATSHIPIVLLTAKADHQDKMEGLGEGADAYLTKPFDASELRLRVKNLLEIRQRLWSKFKASGAMLLEDDSLTSLEDSFLQKVMKTIADNLEAAALNVDFLASEVGLSRAQLNRKLKALTNRSPNQLINDARLSKAHLLLIRRSGSVSEIAYEVGYSNLSYFTKRFREKYGVLPSEVSAES